MTTKRLQQITSGFASATVMVVGDCSLDVYLEVNLSLAELSLETGLDRPMPRPTYRHVCRSWRRAPTA